MTTRLLRKLDYNVLFWVALALALVVTFLADVLGWFDLGRLVPPL